VLRRDEVVFELAHLLLTAIEHGRERRRGMRLLLGARDRRLLGERGLGLGPDRVHGRAGAVDQRAGKLLVEEREHEVLGVYLRIAPAARELARGCNGLL
jgi:hypothetical protein